ncbi:MAG: hypothetical protein JWL75_652 [Parcubacteria group bacterium]|nr:hypothetical protein [Parcubacteria group bacterium]
MATHDDSAELGFSEQTTPEEEKRWEKAFERGASTQGRAKLERYFIELLKTEDFQETIRDLRKRYGYPEGGYKEGITYNLGNWGERKELLRKLDRELETVCKKYGLHFVYWGDVIRSVMSHDEPFIPIEAGADLCMLVDLQNEAEEPFSKEIQDADNLHFPLAIRISPFATQRDILDFIKKHEVFIAQMQEQYRKGFKGIRIGKTKKRSAEVQERNDFIYGNRNLPRREIMELLTEKYGANKTLDMGHISKVISLEKQKRKKL